MCRYHIRSLTNSGVVDVVIGGDHPKIEGDSVHVFFNRNTLGLLQISKCVLHQFREMIRKVAMRDALQVVVVGVLCHPAIEERPCQVVYSILLVFNGLGHNFRIKMIMQKMV